MTPDLNTIVNLGIGGFAIWVLYLQSKKSADSQDRLMSRFKEKDQELIAEIDKRDNRNDQIQRDFKDHVVKVHDSMTKQLSENTKALSHNALALQENTKVMQRVSDHLNTPHNLVIQNNPAVPQKQ